MNCEGRLVRAGLFRLGKKARRANAGQLGGDVMNQQRAAGLGKVGADPEARRELIFMGHNRERATPMLRTLVDLIARGG